MKRVITGALLLATSFGTAFADTPDEIFDYVQTDGSAYIDTGIIGKAGTKASIGMMWKGISDSTDVCFLGARNGSDGRFLLCHAYKFGWNLGYKANWNNPSSTYTPTLPANDVQYTIMTEITSGGYFNFTVNGKSGGRDTTAQGAYNSGFTMYLFANHGTSSGAVANKCPSGTRCYWTKIWQQDANGVYQLVRDFVPCKKGTQVGLWDRVSGNIFYPVAGTLTAGSTVAVHADPDKTLEYVEADGRQYIDTGVNARSGTKATVKLIYTESDTSLTDNYGGYVVLGAKGSSNTSYLYMIRRHYNGDNWRWMTCYGGRYQTLFEDMAKNQTYVLASEITTNGTCKATRNGGNVSERDYSGQTSNGTVVGALDTGVNFYALAANLNGSPGHYAKARLYSMTIEQTGSDGVYQPVRNFTPCEKDGRAALYDSVSGMVFFGRGADLIAPPDTSATPDAFVDYVESDGTQYIDTGINAAAGTRACMEFEKTNAGDSSCLLGARRDADTERAFLCYFYVTTSDEERQTVGYGTKYNRTWWPYEKNTRYLLNSEFTTNGIVKATRNGWVAEDKTTGEIVDTGCPYYIFAMNDNGTASYYAKARLYSMTIEQMSNGVYQVVRDFKPCIKDGVAALYDDISKKIFYPAAGRLRSADETAPAKFVEYVESDGSLYVDTCVKGRVGTKAEMTFVANEGNANPSYLLASTANNVYMHFCYFGNGLNVGFGNKAYNTWWDSYSKGTKYSFGVACSQTQEVNAWRSVANGAPEEKTAIASGGTDSGVNLFAFARNNAGTADGKCSVKLYDMKIWQADDGGTYSLVRDFRPCVATNGIAALYDKISGTIFYPQGGLLATGGVERAVAVTARWKGGAVTAEADLAVAANWDCYDAVGNVVDGALPTVATTVLVGQGSPLLALPAGIAVQDWAGVTLTNSVTLSAAGDWSPLGVMTLANGVTVDLNGNNLVSGGFTLADGTSAAVANSGAAATLTFAVADGNTATMTGITFASNIAFAKTGPGALVNSGLNIGNGGGESLTMSDGHCGVNGLLLIGGNDQTGTFEQSGGTLEVNGWYLTMGYLKRASGTYRMTGGQLFVRTHQMIVGQAPSGSSSFDLSGTGTATLQQGLVIASSGAGSVNVHDGGRLRTSSITKNGTATLTFDGGILEPLGDVTGLLDGMPLTVGGKGFIVDTAGHNMSFGSFTLTDGGELIKVGAGTLTITNSPAWSSVVVSNGTLAVAFETSLTLSSVHVAKGAVLDLGGNTVRCGALSGAGTVVNGTLIVTGTLSVAVGKPLTFTGATLDVSGAQVAVADPESITTRDPVLVATSDQSITGHARTSVSGRRVQISQDGTTYTLELVRNGGFYLLFR